MAKDIPSIVVNPARVRASSTPRAGAANAAPARSAGPGRAKLVKYKALPAGIEKKVTVLPGDKLSTIAKRNRVPLSVLLSANERLATNGRTPAHIYKGDEVLIPKAKSRWGRPASAEAVAPRTSANRPSAGQRPERAPPSPNQPAPRSPRASTFSGSSATSEQLASTSGDVEPVAAADKSRAAGADARVSTAAAQLTASLKPFGKVYTEAELKPLLASLRTSTFGRDGQTMGWADMSDNCYVRARAVYYALTFGALPAYGENSLAGSADEKAQREMMKKIRAAPEPPRVRMINVNVAGSLTLAGSYESPDAAIRARLPPLSTTWTEHHAAIVSTTNGPRIIDLAVSATPLTIDEWMKGFVPAEVAKKLAVNDPTTREQILNYAISKNSHFSDPAPLPKKVLEINVQDIFKSQGAPMSDSQLFPYMWDDVHKMQVSNRRVRDLAGGMSLEASAVPLIRAKVTKSTWAE